MVNSEWRMANGECKKHLLIPHSSLTIHHSPFTSPTLSIKKSRFLHDFALLSKSV